MTVKLPSQLNRGIKMKSEKDWQHEDDARTLMKAQEVMSDKKRHTAAKGHLNKLHDDNARQSLHAKAAQGLRKAFPDEATTGATASSNKKTAGDGKKPPARKKLGNTPKGGAETKGGKTETMIQVKKVPNLKDPNAGAC